MILVKVVSLLYNLLIGGKLMNKFKETLKTIKDRLKYKKNLALFEGILFTIIGLLSLFFDSKIGELTLLFLFPTGIIAIALEIFFLADQYKELDTSKWILLLIEGFLILGLAIYFIFNPIELATIFVKWVGVIIIFKNIMSIVIIPNKIINEYISLIVGIIIGILVIFFANNIVNVLYNILLIIFTIYGLFKISWSVTLGKIEKTI